MANRDDVAVTAAAVATTSLSSMPGILAPPSDVRLGDDFSDMSALLRRFGPNGRNYSDMSEKWRGGAVKPGAGRRAGQRGQRVTPRPHQPVTLTLP